MNIDLQTRIIIYTTVLGVMFAVIVYLALRYSSKQCKRTFNKTAATKT